MHDITYLEERGIPGAFVASAEFQDAADSQMRSLGMTLRAIYVPHPIQDRTDQEMKAIAESASSAVVGALVTSSD